MATVPAKALLFCASVLYWTAAAAQTPGRVEILFLDVGQGDAIVVRSPDGTVALVDAGPDGTVVDLLRRHGILGIDIAIATHAHADHIGGMEQVIQSLPIRYYTDNGIPHTNATYRSLMQALQASDIKYLEAQERSVSLGTVDLTLLPPLGTGDQNSNSVGVLVEYGEFKALLTGDSEIEELQHFLSHGVPDVTVLKAPHHGSRDGLTPEWLNATKPEVVVVSCGLDNPYGHPHQWALRYYRTVAKQVYRTDLDGAVLVLGARDGTYTVKTDRNTDSLLFMDSGRAVRINDGDVATLYNNAGRVMATYVY
jgi:beta-lactamase superfamily II metal-dependent hydrolase